MTTLITPSGAVSAAARAIAEASRGPVAVRGEIESVRASGAHLYLVVSDGQTRLGVTALGPAATRIRTSLPAGNASLARGVTVIAHGTIGLFEQRGTVELLATAVELVAGVGDLEAARRRVQETTKASGLAGLQRQLRTPVAPLRVGVIAPDGQGLIDVETRLAASEWAWELRVLVTPSEGPKAPQAIAGAVRSFSPHVDLLVVTRGGGAGVTAAYDTDVVAAAICQAACPVIVAVGHADDTTVAEFVAWRREPTPTAAAVMLNQIIAAQADDLAAGMHAVVAAAEQVLADASTALETAWTSWQTEVTAWERATVAWPALVPAGPERPDRSRLVVLLAVVAIVMAILVIAATTGALGWFDRALHGHWSWLHLGVVVVR